jgi:protein-tyrosine phosphatase
VGERHLEWEACWNVRDLGGLPVAGGGAIRDRVVIRGDSVDRLTKRGWRALVAHGVRTIIDLRNADELGSGRAARPPEIETVHLPLDYAEARDFWDEWESGPQFATPLYYAPHLERFPERSARVLAAVAAAPPGGVLFHCAGGRDRTGQIAMLLLALVGVPDAEIAADYALSTERLRDNYSGHDDGEAVERFLAARGTTAPDVILSTLAELDVGERMAAGGLSDAQVEALRARLVG